MGKRPQQSNGNVIILARCSACCLIVGKCPRVDDVVEVIGDFSRDCKNNKSFNKKRSAFAAGPPSQLAQAAAFAFAFAAGPGCCRSMPNGKEASINKIVRSASPGKLVLLATDFLAASAALVAVALPLYSL